MNTTLLDGLGKLCFYFDKYSTQLKIFQTELRKAIEYIFNEVYLFNCNKA